MQHKRRERGREMEGEMGCGVSTSAERGRLGKQVLARYILMGEVEERKEEWGDRDRMGVAGMAGSAGEMLELIFEGILAFRTLGLI